MPRGNPCADQEFEIARLKQQLGNTLRDLNIHKGMVQDYREQVKNLEDRLSQELKDHNDTRRELVRSKEEGLRLGRIALSMVETIFHLLSGERMSQRNMEELKGMVDELVTKGGEKDG